MKENHKFSNTLKMWYLMNKRDLPWRKSKDPYFIWLSEIILQQTRISQGTSYYEKFVTEYDDVFALARADESQVLNLWQGLGYYSRARNLLFTAKHIAFELNGKFPDTYKDLIRLKGIGDYTASAIASIAFDKPNATVDGNVYRVLSRYFGISTPINNSKGPKVFKELAQQLLDHEDPGTHNQALMEFGALVCTPKKPKCSACVFSSSCAALQNKMVSSLPVKLKKLKIKNRYLNYIVLNNNDSNTRIRQRIDKDIWQHLYEFPVYEAQDILTEYAQIEPWIAKEFNLKESYTLKRYNKEPIVHKLTHQTLYASFWIVQSNEFIENTTNWRDLTDYALPVLLKNFVDKYQN
jgi:A/G-specific adenine glycosylase